MEVNYLSGCCSLHSFVRDQSQIRSHCWQKSRSRVGILKVAYSDGEHQIHSYKRIFHWTLCISKFSKEKFIFI